MGLFVALSITVIVEGLIAVGVVVEFCFEHPDTIVIAKNEKT